MFKDVKGVTIMQYYQNLKIKEAKILLDKNESATDIAEKLCFDSPQYFSKAFKKKVGKSPIEYKNR
jgi:two-component system response regulator YesN